MTRLIHGVAKLLHESSEEFTKLIILEVEKLIYESRFEIHTLIRDFRHRGVTLTGSKRAGTAATERVC
ncbi:hypothetical protein V8C35DRAFT_310313 [Trichoderma chlorosporum]